MPGSLNLLKLCVGTDTPDELAAWHTKRRRETGRDHAIHITRMWPRRESELLDGGSLYWVMKGLIRARQEIVGLEEITGQDGIRRCGILLAPPLQLTEVQPRRPFQGWRYLKGDEAPRDLGEAGSGDGAAMLPVELASALQEIGVR